jgi:tetratricopeptide (TPR) repeat protein
MRNKSFIISALCFWALALQAQNKAKFHVPDPSPEAVFEQTLGFTKISVAYSRPLTRGRKVFGELVPFREVWRTGAGDCTKIGFNEALTIGDQKIKAGKYALFTIPTADEWTIILNTDTTQHGAFSYDAKKDVQRFTVKPAKSDRFYETFTIEINDISLTQAASLNLMWENTIVKIPLKSSADEELKAIIQKRLVEDKEQNADFMYQAASYYFSTNQDLKQALAWVQNAEKLDAETFYYPNLTTKILSELKDYPAAIEAAKRAIVLGKKKDMKSTVKSLEERIAKWEKIISEKK